MSRTASCGILTRPEFDRVHEAEVRDNPREDLVRVVADPADVVGRSRQIDAQVDPTVLVDLVEAVNPDGRLSQVVLAVVLLLVVLRFASSDGVRMR